jgi:hypothetical protein
MEPIYSSETSGFVRITWRYKLVKTERFSVRILGGPTSSEYKSEKLELWTPKDLQLNVIYTASVFIKLVPILYKITRCLVVSALSFKLSYNITYKIHENY